MFGVLFRNKEWEMNGRTGWTTEACSAIDAQSVRDGKLKMPKDKPLKKSGSTKPVMNGVSPPTWRPVQRPKR